MNNFILIFREDDDRGDGKRWVLISPSSNAQTGLLLALVSAQIVKTLFKCTGHVEMAFLTNKQFKSFRLVIFKLLIFSTLLTGKKCGREISNRKSSKIFLLFVNFPKKQGEVF